MASDAPPPELPPGLLAEYLESARSQLGALAQLAERLAASAGDRDALDELRREAHKIHGSAGSYGFMEASRLAAGMEATLNDWVARPDDADVDRGSLARWFVGRLAEMLGVQVPRAPAAAPRSPAARPTPMPRVGSPPRPSHGSPAKAVPPSAPAPTRSPARAPTPAPGLPPAPPPPPPPPAPAAPPPPAPMARPPGASRPTGAQPVSAPPPVRRPTQPTPRAPAPGELTWVVPPAGPSQAPRAPLTPPPPPPPPPSSPAPAPPTPAAGQARPAAAPAGKTAQVPEVIYVEDDASLAELLEYGLRAHGYRFAAYRNGREALRELLALDVQGTHPLLLLDVDLPALDGYSIFAALERERPGIYRVVFTTVHGTEEEQLRGLEAGAIDYLVKPISLRVALEKIKRWVGR